MVFSFASDRTKGIHHFGTGFYIVLTSEIPRHMGNVHWDLVPVNGIGEPVVSLSIADIF